MALTIREMNSILADSEPEIPFTAELMPSVVDIIRNLEGLEGLEYWLEVTGEKWEEILDDEYDDLELERWGDGWESHFNEHWEPMLEERSAYVQACFKEQVQAASFVQLIELLELDLDDPPNLELIRMGIVVLDWDNEFHVFGRNGQELGSFPMDQTVKNNHMQ